MNSAGQCRGDAAAMQRLCPETVPTLLLSDPDHSTEAVHACIHAIRLTALATLAAQCLAPTALTFGAEAVLAFCNHDEGVRT